jgi:hypothetical protein
MSEKRIKITLVGNRYIEAPVKRCSVTEKGEGDYKQINEIYVGQGTLYSETGVMMNEVSLARIPASAILYTETLDSSTPTSIGGTKL